MTDIDISPEAVDQLWEDYMEAARADGGDNTGGVELYDIEGMNDAAHSMFETLRALSAALERSEESRLEALRRRDKWKAKAEGFEAVRLALREKVGAPWPPSLSRALWAGIAADEKARADTAEAALTASQAETAAAYEAAAEEIPYEHDMVEIRALNPADSKAALDRMIADAEERGMRKGKDHE